MEEMTESVATKEKRCPLASMSACIGSICMAWQWSEQGYEEGTPLPIGMTPADPEWEKAGTTWCAGGEYGSGERRQRWRRPLARVGRCTAFGR